MDGYKSFVAWQAASALCLTTLRVTDKRSHPRTWAVLDQLRRAAVSADVNIVEGYALGTRPQFRRHLRIALASAAEAQRLIDIAKERAYLPDDVLRSLADLASRTIGATYGLIRSDRLPENDSK